MAVCEQWQHVDNTLLEDFYVWGVLNVKLQLSFVILDVTKWKQYPITLFWSLSWDAFI